MSSSTCVTLSSRGRSNGTETRLGVHSWTEGEMRFLSKILPRSRQFVFFIHFMGMDNISLGLHFNWRCPNIEVHLPFCFIKIGWAATYIWERHGPHRSFGLTVRSP